MHENFMKPMNYKIIIVEKHIIILKLKTKINY